jgi:adenine-specific DNA glycosylase
LLGGLWEVPCAEVAEAEQLRLALEERSGLALRPGTLLASVRHLFSHRSLTLGLARFELASASSTQLAPRAADELRWCTPAELDELPLSSLMRKVLKARAEHRQRLL